MAHPGLDDAWLLSWAGHVSTVVGQVMQTFEARFGFAPDRNEIRLATDHDREAARLLTRDHLAAPALTPLYRIIGAITLPDVGNGLFVHSARDSLDQYRSEGAVFLPQSADPHGIVIGSDGGGRLYVADPSGAIHRSVVASAHSEFERVAVSVRDLLELLRQDVELFAGTGQIGVL